MNAAEERLAAIQGNNFRPLSLNIGSVLRSFPSAWCMPFCFSESSLEGSFLHPVLPTSPFVAPGCSLVPFFGKSPSPVLPEANAEHNGGINSCNLKFSISTLLGHNDKHINASFPLLARGRASNAGPEICWPVQSSLMTTNFKPGGARTRRAALRRAVFSDAQRKGLEERFLSQRYISKPDRKKLADQLGLKDSQVKIWFQNRRMKWRNAKDKECDHCTSSSIKGSSCFSPDGQPEDQQNP